VENRPEFADMTAPKSGAAPLSELRKLPKADRLLEAADRAGLVARLGHGPVMDAIRTDLDRARKEVLAGAPCPSPEAFEGALVARLADAARGSLRPVVNATGVVIHTNLGRAPLSEETVAAMRRAAEGYTNLEYDLAAGERGDRYGHAEAALCRLTGAEAAVAVNNNAAGVMLALAALMEARPSESPLTPTPSPRESGGRGGKSETPSPPASAGRGSGAKPPTWIVGEAGAPLAAATVDRVKPTPARDSERSAVGAGVGAEGAGAGSGEGETRPEVIVSRGQLVEIGGGFRIPDVLRRSGAALVEVGTTNRTYAKDYGEAIGPRTRILLSVHRSNFRLSGFTHDASLEELVALARERDLWVVDDLGSGSLLDTAPFGLGAEPTVVERVRAGADLVCFSGDKLLGGPQAGVLAGRREAIARVKRHPLMRALRLDKVTLAGLSATLAHYERGEATEKVPVWRSIALTPEALRARAESWLAALGAAGAGCVVRASRSAIGGGSLPDVTVPTFVLALPPADPDAVAARLRRTDPPVVARIEDGRVVLDPRTVMPHEDEAVIRAVKGAMASAGAAG
jgi:L-seryl-tRNA(Ser) seleniumtransferase